MALLGAKEALLLEDEAGADEEAAGDGQDDADDLEEKRVRVGHAREDGDGP